LWTKANREGAGNGPECVGFLEIMRRHTPLDNITIILAGTKHPGNLGAVCRAMHNMGLAQLRLAAPRCAIDEEARRMAKAGAKVLDAAKTFRSVKSAARGIQMLIGTTGKTGGNRTQCHTPRSLAGRILSQAEKQRVGILFGPEDTGLIDEDLILCQMLLRIPTDSAGRSINLAQAVMITSYELFLAHLDHEPARVPKLASVEQIEAMYAHLERALLAIGFLQPQNAAHMMFVFRRLLGRAGLEAQDVGVLRGLARQIDWFARWIASETAERTLPPTREGG
jgi:tRNA/rRNA methyltransferase